MHHVKQKQFGIFTPPKPVLLSVPLRSFARRVVSGLHFVGIGFLQTDPCPQGSNFDM